MPKCTMGTWMVMGLQGAVVTRWAASWRSEKTTARVRYTGRSGRSREAAGSFEARRPTGLPGVDLGFARPSAVQGYPWNHVRTPVRLSVLSTANSPRQYRDDSAPLPNHPSSYHARSSVARLAASVHCLVLSLMLPDRRLYAVCCVLYQSCPSPVPAPAPSPAPTPTRTPSLAKAAPHVALVHMMHHQSTI
ncbi:hypothetical protein DE146DRAFT_658050, partial [Phaeosphaeria sp. MPI-PUGE-AT-0046c]